MSRNDAPISLDDKYTVESGPVYLSGLQALVRLPMDLQRTERRRGRETAVFVSGYEGSPLGGYDMELLRQRSRLQELEITLKQALNEELAANAVQGTQLALALGRARFQGVTGIWYGKAPGLDRATDAIRHANLSGTHPDGGVVALVGDDGIAKSSTIPSSSEMALAELMIPTLVPGDTQGVLDLGKHAAALSRFSGLWSALKIATNVADGSSSAVLSETPIVPVQPDTLFDGQNYLHTVTAHLVQPVLGELEFSLLHRRLEIARRYARINALNTISGGPDAKVGIVAAGSTYLDVRQALASLGVPDPPASGIRLLRLGMVWPLDRDEIRQFAAGLREIVVVEEKRSFIEAGVRDILYDLSERPMVSGKSTPEGVALLRPEGDLGPDLIAAALAQRLERHEIPVRLRAAPTDSRGRQLLPLAVRTPFFCSGCPHNRSTQAPAGSLVGAGIGCHGMAALLPAERVGDIIGLTQMGGEGAPWIGMSGYVEDTHLVQNLGDGTFHHSGSLAVRAAVAAGVNITYKLLYNSAVAMTGGQQAVGQLSVPQLATVLLAEGVRKVVVTTDDPGSYRRTRLPSGAEVRHRDELMAVQDELASLSGVTVLIHDQECAAELRRKRKRGLVPAPPERAFINARVCEGCGDCGRKSNCLSIQPIETDYGRKTAVHQSSCNLDMSCLQGDCPAFLKVLPRSARHPGSTRTGTHSPITADELPDPQRGSQEFGTFSMRIVGIGGTGVVTVAQIVATAAVIEGRFVRALDQTGLAQKGGAVVSDLKITEAPVEQANKLASRECDLYLGCDLLVASSPANLAVADQTRTAAVVSTAQIPTGAMVINPQAQYPHVPAVVERITDASDVKRSRFLDAHAMTRSLFQDDQFANIFLVGVAVQSGLLPISSDSIEQAITLNDVAVDKNVQAFRHGRRFVVDESERRTHASETAPFPGTSSSEAADRGSVSALIARRSAELSAYQDENYALRYERAVARVAAVEASLTPGVSELTRAVAENLFKLMAYKDEYEVARLSLDPQLEADVEAAFGPGARYAYQLHPPLLRALGMRRKISLGRWFRVVFVLLHAMRRVRGTRIDLFGYAKVRRVERQLVQEYEEIVEEIVARISRANMGTAVSLAMAPDLVRGYEDVKLRSVEFYRERVAQLRDELALGEPAGVDRA